VYTNYNEVRQDLAKQDLSFVEKNNVEGAWLEVKRVLSETTAKHTTTTWK
jgi:hypothetical protein